MSDVDDRIVEMKFENSTFEKRLSETVASLDKLRASLDLAGAGRGLDELSNAGRNFDLSSVGNAADGIGARFSAMAVIGITALAQITSRAVSAGAQLLKSFTLQPILDGFHEFETNMNSIQTILANTSSQGTNLGQVNSALDQLNAYSDKTIYNFSQMAHNVGTFTAAGVNLESSVQSIKGIANLAALSGSSSDQAATAMYQLSQAIAAGRVQLMDWNSVVNAGMGGAVFQKALYETGKALGTITNSPVGQTFEEWSKAAGGFRNSISATASAGADESDKLAKAQKDAARSVADAEENAAEQIANAEQRVTDARESAAKVAKDTAKSIADAQEQVTETAQKAAEDVAQAQQDLTDATERGAADIAQAEKDQGDVFEQTAKDVSDAIEAQQQVLERNAENVQKAIDAVTDAQRRLQDAMKPASEDDLQAATDRLTSSQLDQADLADAVAKAQRDQQRAAEDLAAAQQNQVNVSADATSTAADQLSAQRRVEDAQQRVTDLADAVTRAQLRQSQAAREVTDAQSKLTEVEKKGTDADKNVVDAKQRVKDAEQGLADARKAAADAEMEGTKRTLEVEENAAARRQAALDNTAHAHEDAAQRQAAAQAHLDEVTLQSAKSQTEAQQHLQEVTENAADRQASAAKSVADAEKAAGKARADAADAVARAHENAAERITSAQDSVGSDATPKSWLTSDVLTTALKAFTGDLDLAQLKAMGYTTEQANQLLKIGQTASAAAQDVKTLTQLMGTVRESVGSGWAQTFRIIFGTFDESKGLFTDLNNVIGSFVQSSAKARNDMLQGWKDLGGRDVLIDSFRRALEGIGTVLAPIKDAFRDIFPKTTADDLMRMTQNFSEFADKLRIGGETADKIHSIFSGLFSVLDIGWEVIKGIVSVIGDLVSALLPVGSGLFDASANAGDFLTHMHDILVDGGAIHDFFDKLGQKIKAPIQFIIELTGKIKDFFGTSVSSGLEGAGDRVSSRFEGLTTLFDRIDSALHRLRGIFDKMWEYISTWFKELGNKIAGVLVPGDFDAAVDVVNVGLLGGIAMMLKRFMDSGLSGLLGSGNLIDTIKETFGGLNQTLGAMQANLKAEALMRIAAAVGILTISIVALSLIDSDKLAKSLAAITVGFTQLVGVMMALENVVGSAGSAAKLGIVSVALIGMATAMGILSIAIKNLSGLGWEELAKGLGGVAVGLTLMTAAIQFLAGNTEGLVAAGTAMIPMAIGLLILSKAVESFASMSWGEIGKGLLGVAGGLLVLVTAMNSMPTSGMIRAGVGMTIMGAGLLIIAKAVEEFGGIPMGELAKGLIAIFAALSIIVTAMEVLPVTLPITAAGLVLVGGALIIIAKAVEMMGSIKMGELAKGVGAIAAVMVILAAGLNAMSVAEGGAASLIVAAGALFILAKVVETLGKMKLGDLVKGIVALVGVIAALGIAAGLLEPVIPAMFAMGIAMGLIGASFALFGAGAYLVVKAFTAMGQAGKAGVKAVIEAIEMFIGAGPQIVRGLVSSIKQTAADLLTAIPLLLKLLTAVIEQVLETIIKETPKIAEAIAAIITAGVGLIREKFPDLVTLGFDMLLVVMRGLRDHITDIVTVGAEILTNLATGISNNAQQIVDAAVTILTSFLNAISNRIGDIVAAGLDVLLALIKGVLDNIVKVIEMVATIITTIITELGKAASKIVTAGVDTLVNFLKGISDNLVKVVDAVGEIITRFMTALADNYGRIIETGLTLLTKLLQGIGDNLSKVATTMGDVITKVLEAIGGAAQKFIDAGADVLAKILEGIGNAITKIGETILKVITEIVFQITQNVPKVVEAGYKMFTDMFEAIAKVIDERSGDLGKAMGDLAAAMVAGIGDALKEAIKEVVKKMFPGLGQIVTKVLGFFGISSPSKLFYWIGEQLMLGFGNGIMDNMVHPLNALEDGSGKMLDSMTGTMKKLADGINEEIELNPTITPVLDLTKVQAQARSLDKMMSISKLTPQVSIRQAKTISTTTEMAKETADAAEPAGPTELTFVQNNYSPDALTTGDIYRNTKSQIALAKEELGI